MRAAAAVAALSVLAAAASAAPDDRVEISVRDLVMGAGNPTPPSATASWPVPSGGPSPAFSGAVPQANASREPAVPAEALGEILGLLSDGVPPETDLRGDRLVARPEEAAAVRGSLARIRAQRPAPVDLEYALEVSGEGGAWRTLLSGREPVGPGERRVFGDARDRAVLTDFDVEIASAAQVPDPIVHVQRTGASIELRVLPFPRGDSAILDVAVDVTEPLALPPIQPHHADFAPMDRAAVARDEAHLTFRAERGRASEQVWTGRGGRTVRLRVTPRWTPAPADSGPGALLWSPILSQPLYSRRFVGYCLKPAGEEADENWPVFGKSDEMHLETPDRVQARFDGKGVRWTEPTASGLVAWGGPEAAAARDSFAASLDEELRGFRVEVTAREAVAGGAPGRELFRASGDLVADVASVFSRAEAQGYFQDVDVEVAASASIVDPIIDVLVTGDFCNLRAVSGPDGTAAALDLDLQMSRLESMETEEVPVVRGSGSASAPLHFTDDKGQEKEGTVSVARSGGAADRTSYVLEKPAVREIRFEGLYRLGPDGRVVLRRAAPGFLGEGKEIVVEVTVK
jgi:hypothetical protein